MNLLKTAEIKDVYSKISKGNSLNLEIRYYQRPYKWPAKMVSALFEDYYENKRRATAPKELEYFFGAIVLVDLDAEEGVEPKNWKYQIVDGQQRLTTLFLFNYLRFLLLIAKADILAERKNYQLIACLDELEECYKGFIGVKNTVSIHDANEKLKEAFQTAITNGTDIENRARNYWRKALGWISDPDLADEQYVEKCMSGLNDFFRNEDMRLTYANKDYNDALKKALSSIVVKASSSYAVELPIPVEIQNEIDDESEVSIEWPFVLRVHNIFNKVRKNVENTITDPFSILTKCIEIIQEMLSNINMCMIITPSEDDAFKLFETLNDRSESVSDLELIKDYFYKTYAITSGESKENINSTIALLDTRWKEDIFGKETLKDRIAYCVTVLLSGKKDIKQNDAKRKNIKLYLEGYNNEKSYKSEIIKRDFDYLEYISIIFSNIVKDKKEENNSLSLYVENSVGHDEASIVKRALALAVHLDLQAIFAAIICDILFTFNQITTGKTFKDYLNSIFREEDCKREYLGLWRDCNVMWKTIIMAPDYVDPKVFADKLIDACYIEEFTTRRELNRELIEFSTTTGEGKLVEADLAGKFETWLGDWSFKDNAGKIKIKNLFVHLYDRYDKNADGKLALIETPRSYKDESIKQDLDHMDAKTIPNDCGEKEKFYSYDNVGLRVTHTNKLGNMMALPEKINRGKHNTPIKETLDTYTSKGLTGWIFTEATDIFNRNKEAGQFEIPKNTFFEERKDRLIQYFKLVVENQKETPNKELDVPPYTPK